MTLRRQIDVQLGQKLLPEDASTKNDAWPTNHPLHWEGLLTDQDLDNRTNLPKDDLCSPCSTDSDCTMISELDSIYPFSNLGAQVHVASTISVNAYNQTQHQYKGMEPFVTGNEGSGSSTRACPISLWQDSDIGLADIGSEVDIWSENIQIHHSYSQDGNLKKKTKEKRLKSKGTTSHTNNMSTKGSAHITSKTGRLIFWRFQVLFCCVCFHLFYVLMHLYLTQGREMKKVIKRNEFGETRLQLACQKRDLALVKALIQAGSNVNTKDNAG